jgi:hypothetical protein
MDMSFQRASWSSLLLIAFAVLISSVECARDPLKTLAKPNYTFDQLWELEKSFWDSFLYPANVKQTEGNASSVFATDVRRPRVFQPICPLTADTNTEMHE